MAHHHSDHSHSHSHHDHAAPNGNGRSFVIAIVLNTLFVAVEFGYGFVANSTALMADAGHNLSDVLGLLLAWGALILAKKTPDARYTYGLRSSSILAALANAVLLLLACGGIAWEAIQRFSSAPPVASTTVMVVAAMGIVINGVSALLFAKGRHGDLNIRGAYLHMMADAAISLGVVVTGGVMLLTQWYWLDPLVSLVIVVIIVIGAWGLLRQSVQMVMSAVPHHVDGAKVADYLQHLKGVTGIHDLHIWGMSTTECALTVHLVMPEGYPGDGFMDEVAHQLQHLFSITHSTLQVEMGTTEHACSLHGANA
jgi:cobalt-zinc-cadmium efflux system protein